jgi:hypothetical protein
LYELHDTRRKCFAYIPEPNCYSSSSVALIMAEATAEPEVAAHGGARLAKDLFSGAMGGIAQVLLGSSACHDLTSLDT